MKKIINETVETGKTGERGNIGEKVNNKLHALCDSLSPRKRLIFVFTSLTVFAVLAVYMAVSSIFFAQRPELNIEHIEGLKLQRTNNDSINNLKFKNYDKFE